MALSYHTVDLKNDGTCVAISMNGQGQCNVIGWIDIKQVASDLKCNIILLKFFLKQNNQYHSITSFYDVNTCQYRPCDKECEVNRFENLSDLIKNINCIEIKKDEGNVDILKFDSNNNIKNMEVI